ncbi:PREDICTED: uncharacterized protein LOC106785387 isoform X2 [Polistes canadensis]|uniref:uncharacterized protein LOC106785387 isoform X2 n=1 Tax=Polistes canadensis TaxID=91411 RepID=UPI000718B084|nr:PREDICTED: uncharacterized protein LOC106785387 isoform X2 [Polistes canadensis]
MGNTRSQPCRRNKPLYLLYLIHRTWSMVADHRKTPSHCDDIDRETELSSRCSGCNDCAYRQDSLAFDSESDMAPNAEEELLVVKPWGPQTEKEPGLRPPTYNAEDYAIALRRWGRRPLSTIQDSQDTLPSTTSSSSGYISGSAGEMTLRQFTSVSELLNKLRADLRLAFPSFVQEFASPPADGITLLLETLRGVQLAQSSPPTSGQVGPRVGTRRAALDELGCVECLAACGERCADAPRLLVQAQPGLLALAVCLTSSLNRSRVLALQLLTKVCQTAGGHAAVSEAVSTLRLKYGEGGRFRFLAGALLAPRAAIALRVAGVSFLNAFLKSAPRTQTRLYIQAEACEAGLEPQVLQEWLRESDGREEDTLTDLLRKEVQKWAQNCVDVDALQRRVLRAEETCRILSKKVSALQNQLEKLQVEKLNNYNAENRDNMSSGTILGINKTQKVSSNAEDEGISSSERSSSPEDIKHQSQNDHQKITAIQDNDQETTIDDVIEELRIIVKDAEEEFSDKNQERSTELDSNDPAFVKNSLFRPNSKLSYDNSEVCLYEQVTKREQQIERKIFNSNTASNNVLQNCQEKGEQVTYFGNDRDYSDNSSVTRRLSSDGSRRISKSSLEGSVKIVVKGPDVEDAIVPTILHPQPPRRTPPCLSALMAVRHCNFADHNEPYNSHDEELEEETLGDGSDSLLSASRLKYNEKNQSYEEHIRETAVVEHFQKRSTTGMLSNNIADKSGKFRKSFDDLHHFGNNKNNLEGKTIRNYEPSISSKARVQAESGSIKQVDAYRQYETSSKVLDFSKHQTDRQSSVHRHGSKYKSEVEKRKLLRRSTSHDYLDSNTSTPRSRRSTGSRVECRIRKFESLNSFDEHRSLQNYGGPGSTDNLNKEHRSITEDFSKSKMRRSESFHHVSHIARKDQCSSRGGSDSGLIYITDYNLDPLVTRRPRSIEAPKSPNLLTKSLDRIDEGLDSMVNIVITEEKNEWNANRHQPKSNNIRNDKQSIKVKSNKLDNSKSNYADREKQKARREESMKNRQWNYHKELELARRDTEINCETTPMGLSKTESKHNSFGQNKSIVNRFSNKSNDSGIFAGRTYDTFGLGKNRFNAGKYSGDQRVKDNPLARRNTTSSVIGKRGKVTDVVSGLY